MRALQATKTIPKVLALAFAAAAILVMPAPASAAPGDIEIFRMEAEPIVPGALNQQLLQAGAHPNFRIFFSMCDNPPPRTPTTPGFPGPDFGCTDKSASDLKDFTLRLPPGLLGAPTAVPPCPTHLWLAGLCDPASIVGFSFVRSAGETSAALFPTDVNTPLYNVQTLGLEPARLGTAAETPSTPPGPFPVLVTLRTASDFGIDSTVMNVPTLLGGATAKVWQIDTLLCARAPCRQVGPDALFNQYSGFYPTRRPIPVILPPPSASKPFFVNPTSCKPASVTIEARSWQAPENIISKTSAPFTPNGCENVPFEPTVNVTPDTTQAGAPSGYSVEIQYPDYADDPIWQSQLKDAEVTLPDGVSLAPAGGAGLEACSLEEFGFGNDRPVRCPNGSQIGDITVETPALANSLQGKAFFGPTTAPGRPTPDKPWKLFLLIEGSGLRVKLPPGDVTVSDTGQITTTFRNQPEVPFTRFVLHTRGGPNAVLANPSTCQDHFGSVTLTGHSGAVRSLTPTVTPTGCASPQPFQPTVDEASASPTQAGAFSRSHLVMSRPDGHQLLKRFNLSLPAGAAGSLANVPLCPKDRAAVGDCNPEHKVGHVRTTVGTADGLLTTSGSIFIGEPLEAGDAASFVAVVPAKVGPIDLGKVVAVNRVRLRPSDTGVDVFASDLPTLLEGVPLAIRKIEITVDRENFFFNPTGCDTRQFNATFFSDQGATANAGVSLAATGCDAIPFNPKLRLVAGDTGLTEKDSHPPLSAIVTQQPGEANIAKARVVLPDIIRPNVPQIQKPGALCNDAQLAARNCPPLSLIGSANVITPALPFPLSGPVYIVLKAGSPLPNLAIFLRGGGLEVVLSAGNGFEGIKILNTFDAVPDVPQSRFELRVNGGSNGILNAFSDLCDTRPLPTFDARFTGHNGKVASSKPQLETEGCDEVGTLGASISSSSVRVSKKRVAKIRVRCRQEERCRGRLSLRGIGNKSFSIRGGKRKTVKVKLSRKDFRALRRRKRMRVRATTTVGEERTRRTITLRPPRR